MTLGHLDISITAQDQLTRLVYELLDAHDDTVRLSADDELDASWSLHLAYLRDLQRVGRELLAHTDESAGRTAELAAGGRPVRPEARPL